MIGFAITGETLSLFRSLSAQRVSQILNDYKGVIIEESLEDKGILKDVRIVETKVSQVTERHKTPWLAQWTLHTVMIPFDKSDWVANEISRVLDRNHGGSWYADFRNDKFHFIVFRDKIFKVDTGSPQQYEEVRKYGRNLGIPEYQLDFTPPEK